MASKKALSPLALSHCRPREGGVGGHVQRHTRRREKRNVSLVFVIKVKHIIHMTNTEEDSTQGKNQNVKLNLGVETISPSTLNDNMPSV